jgi:methyltransferase (TIGR00027 family)
VFEVDHPATQAWKRELLASCSIAPPASLAFAAIDFERETLPDALRRADFDPSAPAFVAWLGVTPYLASDVVLSALGTIARHSRGGAEVVFDFAAPPPADGRSQQSRDRLAARTGAVGEPLKSTFAPEALAADLTALGYSEVEPFDSALLNRRYFGGRADALRLRGGNLMAARR